MTSITRTKIDWTTLNIKGGSKNSDDSKFLERSQDLMLEQYITKPTRWRGSNTPNVLDLLFTNEQIW